MPTQGKNQGQGRGQNQGGQGQGEGRGFASMDDQKQRAIASEGGRAAHQSGKAHEFSSEEAREAGRKGGQASGGGNRSAGGSDSQGGSRAPGRSRDDQ